MVRNRLGISLNINKDVVEDMCELVKQKSLYEQALELVGLKIEQEFEFDFGGYGINGIYVLDKHGILYKKITGRTQGWETTTYDLVDIILSNKKPVIYKPKSEAELILDELEKVVDKAKAVLERSGR